MPALARAAIGDSLLNVVTGIGTAKDPRTSTRYHLRLLEKNVLEHMYRREASGRLAGARRHQGVANVADEQQERSGRQGS
jgi:hypothetical protein